MPMAGLDSLTAGRAAACKKFIQKALQCPPLMNVIPSPMYMYQECQYPLCSRTPRLIFGQTKRFNDFVTLLNINVLCNVLCNAFAGLPSNSVITAIGLNKQASTCRSCCFRLARHGHGMRAHVPWPLSQSNPGIALNNDTVFNKV